MQYKNVEFTLMQAVMLVIYKIFLSWLPSSTTPILGKTCRNLRYLCCKNIFLYCGKNVNIEKGAEFGSGFRLKIGNNSGVGINRTVPGDIEIGNDVMIGSNCHIFSSNHAFDRIGIPMIQQGHYKEKKTIIEDDVWIGRFVIFTLGRYVKKGTNVFFLKILKNIQ